MLVSKKTLLSAIIRGFGNFKHILSSVVLYFCLPYFWKKDNNRSSLLIKTSKNAWNICQPFLVE